MTANKTLQDWFGNGVFHHRLLIENMRTFRQGTHIDVRLEDALSERLDSQVQLKSDQIMEKIGRDAVFYVATSDFFSDHSLFFDRLHTAICVKELELPFTPRVCYQLEFNAYWVSGCLFDVPDLATIYANFRRGHSQVLDVRNIPELATIDPIVRPGYNLPGEVDAPIVRRVYAQELVRLERDVREHDEICRSSGHKYQPYHPPNIAKDTNK